MSQSSPASVTSTSNASLQPSSMSTTDCVPRISDLDFARISRLLVPNSAQANPFQPDSFSVAEVATYHDIILDLFREFCKAYPAGSLIWHQVENDKKERDEEKALNAAQKV
ncbi:hypothetical protein PSTG_10598 [Puccinia striiformis f. sp. tritici PST-78]|uniref:Uncharacterized protein n=1 Tax=Puccinia striiformis f. sp. tritici PST-78 TaxID=1165861 RepID=A0A0L0VA76_9BASI|nr:hypothetical protein PSTG_10598 [Puccinia striiformis f. sp. tritici PST-78]